MAITPVATDRIARIRRMLEENYNDRDLFSPHYVSHKPWDLMLKRRAKTETEALKANFNPRKIFPDAQISVEDAVQDGDKVVIRWRLRGTWSQPVAGIKATNSKINITGVNIYRFVGDKIVEEFGEFDSATFGQQAFSATTAAACQEALTTISRPPESVFGPGGQVLPGGPIVAGPVVRRRSRKSRRSAAR
jgi:predicted ester cyclase